jgi:outer membrane protein OmpA-like peptidoglycan-associated protein
MRYPLLLFSILLAAAAPAAAQVTVNPQALAPLSGGSQAPSPSGDAQKGKAGHGTKRVKRAAGLHSAPAKPEEEKKPAEAKTGASAAHGPPSKVHNPPVVPAAPPPTPVLAPLQPPPPPHASPPPEPAPVVAGAVGEAIPVPGGVRVTFAAGAAELNPETDAALQKLARLAAGSAEATVSVVAYAAGSPDDPSTTRRLSLSRALAARTVLIAEGIPSTRIFVRALGAPTGEGPADRVDVTVSGLAAPAKPPQ